MKDVISASFTNVKDEVDVIESFVRHNLRLLDRMYIADNLSSDGTREVLEALADEGLPVTILEDPVVAWDQSRKSTDAMAKIMGLHPELRALYFLDADEFLIGERDEMVPDGAVPGSVFEISRWRYVMGSDGSASARVLDRMSLRSEVPERQKIMIVPPSLQDLERFRIGARSHRVYRDGLLVEPVPIPVSMGHFAIRSREQYMRKVVLGWLAILQVDGTQREARTPIGVHWRSGYLYALDEGLAPSLESFRERVEGHFAESALIDAPIPQPELFYESLATQPSLAYLLTRSYDRSLEQSWDSLQVARRDLRRARLEHVHDLLMSQLAGFSWTKSWVWQDKAAVLEFDLGGSTAAFDLFLTADELAIQLVFRDGKVPTGFSDGLRRARIAEVAVPGKAGRFTLGAIKNKAERPSYATISVAGGLISGVRHVLSEASTGRAAVVSGLTSVKK